MAALLTRIQKNKKKSEGEVSPVVINSDSGRPSNILVMNDNSPEARLPERSPEQQGAVDEADVLLAELLSESNASGSRPSATDHKIVLKSPLPQGGSLDVGTSDAGASWWLQKEEKEPPQLALLIDEAINVFESMPAEESSSGKAIHEAVARATQNIRSGSRGAMSTGTSIRRGMTELVEQELRKLVLGHGPLDALYQDDGVTDIFIDSHSSVKVLRKGHAIETPFKFRSEKEYKLFIRETLKSVDRVLSESQPLVDCVLHDTFRSRVSAIHPAVIDGDEPRMCIRIPRLHNISFFDILQTKTLPPTLAAWFAELVACGEANILVVGPTGAGKTVMTTALLSSVGSDERVVTIEDVPELFVPTQHLEKLVTRPADEAGEGEVGMADLLRAALRRSPHRIVVGEIRDEEARLFIRALETGHAGSIATIHSNSSVDALWRLVDLISAHEKTPERTILRRIARSVHLTIVLREVDGSPCLIEVAEISSDAEEGFRATPLVSFKGVRDGKRRWQIHERSSRWLDRLSELGMDLNPGPSLDAVQPSAGEIEEVETIIEDVQ